MEVSKEYVHLHKVVENRFERFQWFLNNEGPASGQTYEAFMALCKAVDDGKTHPDYAKELSHYIEKQDAEGLSSTFMAQATGQLWSFGYILLIHQSKDSFVEMFQKILPQPEVVANGVGAFVEA